MEKAPSAADCSRCLARGEYSIDQPKRLGEAFLPQRDLPVGDRVDRRRDFGAQRAQLSGAENNLAHARTAAAEDEVVGTELRELVLRLLDQEQVPDQLGDRP